ncbi:MAG: bifunctional adenosylcobinamide kinase/adenosylcobinamide-phosphate guanylyltransferase [Fusicatenibacter sp.]|nr:bifunctional adenosylcobinamide kinase/adenosylcobinamide-phosphate guanylyltransferase [Lachnospiraceae bacterium]MDY2937483.1 bifunctional adenosylcobinamide kinase/adenosylcobinamide-phosphate guanylyltransferase [Fusicatenibacter sp.]
MKLIIGGAYQGKLFYAKEAFQILDGWQDGAVCTEEELADCRGVFHFHEQIRRWMKEESDPMQKTKELLSANPEICIVTNELGYGVVPVDAFDRKWRETTGRIGTLLAQEADEVHRVVCGIGMILKGGMKK